MVARTGIEPASETPSPGHDRGSRGTGSLTRRFPYNSGPASEGVVAQGQTRAHSPAKSPRSPSPDPISRALPAVPPFGLVGFFRVALSGGRIEVPVGSKPREVFRLPHRAQVNLSRLRSGPHPRQTPKGPKSSPVSHEQIGKRGVSPSWKTPLKRSTAPSSRVTSTSSSSRPPRQSPSSCPHVSHHTRSGYWTSTSRAPPHTGHVLVSLSSMSHLSFMKSKRGA